MARLQILELPVEHHGDDMVTPFVLVIDQYHPLRYVAGADMTEQVVDEFEGVAEKIGARAVLTFVEPVEIHVNDPAPPPDTEHAGTTQIVYAHERTRLDLCNALLVSGDTTWRKLIETVSERQRVVAQSNRALDELARLLGLAVWQGWDDIKVAVENHHTLRKVAERDAKRCEELRDESRRRGKVKLEYAEKVRLLESQLEDARTWARHGYEIGQKHCGWTDYGVAPDWLTEGWPTHFDSCKHLKQATEYDTALSRVLQVADDLENEEAHGGVWDANQQAARLIRAAVGRARDEKAAGS